MEGPGCDDCDDCEAGQGDPRCSSIEDSIVGTIYESSSAAMAVVSSSFEVILAIID